MTRTSGSFAALLMVMLAACSAQVPRQSAVQDPAPTTQASAQRIYLDPVTGTPRSPTRDELRQLQSQSPTKALEAPKVVEYPDGTVGVFLQKPKNQIHVEMNEDGSLRASCKDDSPAQEKP